MFHDTGMVVYESGLRRVQGTQHERLTPQRCEIMFTNQITICSFDDELSSYVQVHASKNHQTGRYTRKRTTPRGEMTKELAKSMSF